jgi:deoxyribonuclease V
MPEHRHLHDWDVSPASARAIQARLRGEVREEPLDAEAVATVAGTDLSFDRGSDTAFAGVVLLSLPELQAVERRGVRATTRFPYVPGLLSFRETPPLLAAWEGLRSRPDVLIVDGQGRAHPRRFGIACHLGLLLDLPTIGCAKSILVGTHGPVGEQAGDWAPLVHAGETVGAALRTRPGVTPVYISVGHRVDLPSALALVRRCLGPTRIPEPTRQAHLFVNALRRGEVEASDAAEPRLPGL